MEQVTERAAKMLTDWKGEAYTFGFEVLNKVGDCTAQYGRRALLMVADLGTAWVEGTLKTVIDSLKAKGVEFEIISGAAPNAPREDLYRLALQITRARPEVIIALGGGSTIDAAKAADVLAT